MVAFEFNPMNIVNAGIEEILSRNGVLEEKDSTINVLQMTARQAASYLRCSNLLV